jgi:hypothetical protein
MSKKAANGHEDSPDEGTSMLRQMLSRLEGKQAVIVMGDERSFKGRIGEFDEKWLILEDALEGSAVNSRGWEEVVLNTGHIGKRFTDHGVITEQEVGELVRLEDVLINLSDVRRVWPWEPDNVSKPEHVTVETKNTVF